jgi:hypothetical protein
MALNICTSSPFGGKAKVVLLSLSTIIPKWLQMKHSGGEGNPPRQLQAIAPNKCGSYLASISQAFTGAPLDLIKIVAASLMVVDHANVIFLEHHLNALWYLGRVAFPLFCFVVACHLERGANVSKYVVLLLLVGALSQPLYTMGLSDVAGNTLFTLAIAVAIATVLLTQRPCVQHIVFLAAAISILSPFIEARSGVDFGLAGMLFPAAILLVLHGRCIHVVWVAVFLIGLNWHNPNPWQYSPIPTTLFAGVGSAVILFFALAFRGRPRFVPRFTFHVVYPGHLLVLMVIHAIL